jgi:hypothetical protein
MCYVNVNTFYAGQDKSPRYWTAIGGKILGSPYADSVRVKWDSAASGTIILKLTNAGGCDSSCVKTIKLLKLTELQISGPSIVCENHENLYHTDGLPKTSYAWNSGGGNFTLDSLTNITGVRFTRTGSFKVRLYYRNSSGCEGYAEKPIQVFSLPVPQISGNQKACAYSKGNLYKENVYQVQNRSKDTVVFSWTVSGANTFTQVNNSTIRVNWGAPGVYRIGLHQRNVITNCENETEFFVTVDSMPKPKLTHSNYSGCVQAIQITYVIGILKNPNS